MADTVTSIVTTKAGSYRITHPADATDDQIRAYTADYLKKVEPETNFPAAEIDRPKPESFVQGVEQGASKVAYNAARAAETVADGLGVREPLQQFGAFINPGASHASVNDAQAEFNQAQDARDTQGSGFGQFVGEVGATLPLAALPGGVATQGAMGGALLTDARTPGGVAIDAAKGALGAKLVGAGLKGAKAIINPEVSGDVRTLLNEGVELTPGQIAGGAIKRGEDIAASVPFMGSKVADAQANATATLNRAAATRPLRAIGERLPRHVETGTDAVKYAGDRLSAAYSEVLPKLSGALDRTFEGRVAAIDSRANLPQEYAGKLQSLKDELGNAFQRNGPDGVYSGRTLRDTSERLGDMSKVWGQNDDPYVRRLGDVAQQYRDQLHALARRQNPDQASRLRDIDRGWASLVRLERGAAGTADGVMTPAQYASATRMADTSVRRRATARGTALDQDLSGAGRRVMQTTASQGGSKDVNSTAALIALGAGALGGRPAALAGLTGIVGGSQLYTPTALDLARRTLGRETGPVSDALGDLLLAGSKASPILTPAVLKSRGY